MIFGRSYNIGMQKLEPRRSHLLALLREVGQGDPERRGILKGVADEAGVNPQYLSHVKNGTRPMSDDMAEKLTKAYRKPKGWFDRPIDLPFTDDAKRVALLFDSLSEKHRNSIKDQIATLAMFDRIARGEIEQPTTDSYDSWEYLMAEIAKQTRDES